MASLDDFIEDGNLGLPASIEDLLSEPNYNNKTPNFFSRFKNNLYSHLKNYVKNIKEYKFSFSLASVTLLTDRILTYAGIKYRGFYEGNNIVSFFIDKVGLVASMGITYLGFMMGGYFITKYLSKKVGMTNKEVGRSVYGGIGAAEGIVSLHNYFLYAGVYNLLTTMAFPPFFGLLSAVALAPYTFYALKKYFKGKRSKQEKYKEKFGLDNKDELKY